MDDEPRIITVGHSPPPPDIAKWLREQPHHRRIVMTCVDAPSLTGEHPIAPSSFPCIHVGVHSLVGGIPAVARIVVADHQASDPNRLIQLIIEEAEAAFSGLVVEGADGQQ